MNPQEMNTLAQLAYDHGLEVGRVHDDDPTGREFKRVRGEFAELKRLYGTTDETRRVIKVNFYEGLKAAHDEYNDDGFYTEADLQERMSYILKDLGEK